MPRRSTLIATGLLVLLACHSVCAQPRRVRQRSAGAAKQPAAKLVARIGPVKDWTMATAFSPDGRLLAVGTWAELHLYDVATRQILHRIDVPAGYARAVTFDGKSRLAVGGYQYLAIWELGEKPQLVRKFDAHRGYVTDVAFAPDGKRLASASEDGTARVWNLDTGEQVRVFKRFRYPVYGVAFSPDRKRLATASGDPTRPNKAGHIRVWDVATGKEQLFPDAQGTGKAGKLVEHLKVATRVTYSPTGRFIASTSYDEKVHVYDAATGKAYGFFSGHSRATNAVVFATDDTLISVSGGRAKGKNEVKIWNRADGVEHAGWEAHRRSVTAVALSPDRRLLATTSVDKTVALWDVSKFLKPTATGPIAAPRPVAGTAASEGARLAVLATAKLPVGNSSDVSKVIRIGMIGLDTSHATAFTRTINGAKGKPGIAGVRVVAAYPHGSADIKSSASRIPGYTKQMQDMGIEITASIPDLLKQVDAVLLETNDGRPHLEQALLVFKAGKPVFIDKPLAASLADCVALFQAARKYKVPMFSSSSLRYSPGAQAIRKAKLDIRSAETYSPAHLEKTHPDLFWYGIHGVELLFTVMGEGCQSVERTVSTKDKDIVVGVWSGGRKGTFSGYRAGKGGYGGSVATPDGKRDIGRYGGYPPLVNEIVRFFKTGKPPVGERETLEIYAFMEAADESKRRGGKPVKLADVLKQAAAKAEKRLAELDR